MLHLLRWSFVRGMSCHNLCYLILFVMQLIVVWTRQGSMHSIVHTPSLTTIPKTSQSSPLLTRERWTWKSTNTEKLGFIKGIEAVRQQGVTMGKVIADSHIQRKSVI